MILYDFKCASCGNEWEGLENPNELKHVKCGKCGGTGEIQIGGNRNQVKLFPEGFFEDIAPEPIYIRSRAQLREECKKHGCYAKYNDGYAGY